MVQPVTVVSRDHMHMEVPDVLATGWLVVLPRGDAVTGEGGAHGHGDPLGQIHTAWPVAGGRSALIAGGMREVA
jgi:hypothetical protein